MTARFAGARTIDQRRRRRLAQEPGDGTDGPADTSVAAVASTDPVDDEQLWLPDDSIIPRSGWKLGAAVGMAVCGWAGLLWAGIAVAPRSFGLTPYVSLEGGRLAAFFSTVMLLMSAKASLIILWYRARSRKDFMGRYRIWAWAGMFWGLTCFAQATGLHIPLANYLAERYPLEIHRPELTYWLLPFAVCFLATHRVLALEMRQSRLSETCWNLMLLLAVGVGGLQLGLDAHLPPEFRIAVVTGCTTLWYFSIWLSLLVHARYVVHVTNEAGPRKSNFLIRLYRRIRLAMAKSKAAVPAAAEDAKPAAKKKAAKAEASPESTKAKPSPVRTPVAAETEEDLAAEEAKAAKKRVLGQKIRMDTPAAAPVPEPHVTKSEPAAKVPKPPRFVDEDDEDEEDYGAISRKDRKRMKKMQRSQDRDD